MKPSELAITLAALPGRFTTRTDEGWVYADEIRGRLVLLGFEVSAQQVAASLRRMAKVDAPWVEVRSHPHFPDMRQYRVTQWGKTDIGNRFPGVQPVMPWLPTYRSTPQTTSASA